MRRWPLGLACLLVWMVTGIRSADAQPATGRLTGVVVDPTGRVLPGATITVNPAEAAALPPPATRAGATTRTDDTGQFTVSGLVGGLYTVIAERAGFAPATIASVQVREAEASDVRLVLQPAPVSEVVDVVGSTGAGNPIERDDIHQALLRVFQLPSDRFQEALPLLPGVIRDPRGRLSFNGTRPSQSALLVNGINATDPVTGQFAFDLPLSVVDTVEVHAIPYSAEFGHVSGAVTNVRTIAGDDTWRTEFGSLVPNPRFRSGTLMGINTATPRAKISGPISRGRAWVSQAFAYRFGRSQVKEELPGEDEEVVEGFDAFTQIDLRFNEGHSLTGTLSFFPSTIENVGIDSLHPYLATPRQQSGGWNVALVDELATGPRTLWQTIFAMRGYDVEVTPQGSGVAVLTPDGLSGNYFNRIERDSRQLELGTARLHSWQAGTQTHLVKIGGQLLATSFSGTDLSGPIDVRGIDGRLMKRITFRGAGELESSDVITSAYVQDYWQVSPRLALDLGLRSDNDAMLGEHNLSPRLAFSLAFDRAGRTLVKGGWGLFFDQVFLHVDAFERFQQRVEQEFSGIDERPAGPPIVFENRRGPGELEEPTSRVWNLEFDRQLGEALLVRVNYRENRATGRLIVDRQVTATDAALVLASSGRLTAREFDTTVRWTLAGHGQLFASFSKMRSSGDLNDFGHVYDNLRDPLVFENERTFQAFEVPNRVLAWGVLTLPRGFTVTPGIEWRTGFPYTLFSEDYTPVGARHGARFPYFFSADVGVTKRVRLFGQDVDVGIQAYNLTNHANPRDVVANRASSFFGDFRNSVNTSVSLKLGVGL